MSSAHDTRLEIGGDLYWVRRDFDLIRRIEQAFGALAALEGRLRRFDLTADEIMRLLKICLKAQASRPPDEDIQEHILDEGVPNCCEQLALVVLHLFSGHKRTIAWLEAEAKATEEDGAAADPNPPKADSSRGITTSRRRRRSAGGRASSGVQPSTT